MTFAQPLVLLWGLLAVPVVILYLRRIRLRREPVATGMFWQQVLAEQRVRSAWQRWRHGVSLAVQLIVLGLIVTALADPQIPGPRKIVLVVDNSASMSTTDVAPRRLAEAKEAASRLVAGLRAYDQAAILSAGDAVAVCCNFSSDRKLLEQRLDQIEAQSSGGATGVDAAVELAREVLAETGGGKIIVVTDGCFRGSARLAEADDVELIRVGRRTGNVAVTRLAARRSRTDPAKCQVLVAVRSFCDRPVEGTLAIQTARGGAAVAVPVTGLAPEGRWHDVFEVTAPEADRITVVFVWQEIWPEGEGSAPAERPPMQSDTAAVRAPGPEIGSEPRVAETSPEGERDLRVAGDIGQAATDVTVRRPGVSPWLLLVGAAVVLLSVEWGLYQRRWIC